MRSTVLAAAIVLAAASPGLAETPVDAARALIVRYDQDLTRLDRAREVLEAAAARDPQPESLTLLARVHYLWGDVRATSAEQKLAAYERGREAGRRAVELAPKSAEAHLWYAVNTGRWGQTKGVVQSLFLLRPLRQELETVFALDPKLPGAHSLAGNVDFEVPGLFGGDRARAEEHFKTALALDPKFTGARVDLARLYLATGRPAEARRELQAVIDETAPTNLADWTVKDLPRARALLETVKDRR
ncbi:MAG: tetratricopeptide repeat protein [Candidatus Rokubacteria bacterium]|nr:tetratricopeptide repeat protein [Candidatus Rokubacteria bacterium]MBI3825372.1 tetratricopeptide repeat protein [Candidatus Rokubacteria bacterium]